MIRNLARLWHAQIMITAAVAILTGPGVASATPINDLSTVPTRASQTMVSEETGQHDALFIGNDGFAAGAQTVVAEKPPSETETPAPRSLLTKKILTASSTLALFLVGLAGITYLVRRHRRTIEYLCPIWRQGRGDKTRRHGDDAQTQYQDDKSEYPSSQRYRVNVPVP